MIFLTLASQILKSVTEVENPAQSLQGPESGYDSPQVFDQVKEVESIQAEGGQEAVAQTSTQWKRFRHMYDGWLGQCFTKFHVFGLVEYDKVIWLDADMLALRSPDELSLIEAPAGICSLFEAEDAAGNARHGELISKAEVCIMHHLNSLYAN